MLNGNQTNKNGRVGQTGNMDERTYICTYMTHDSIYENEQQIVQYKDPAKARLKPAHGGINTEISLVPPKLYNKKIKNNNI